MNEADVTSSSAARVAVVTGGSRGLGRGIVEALAGRGVRVVALARDELTLAALAREVPGVVPVAGDAADESLALRVVGEHEPDLVVLCAGAMPHLGALQTQSWADFQINWEVDAKSTFVWLKLALTRPLKRGAHVIVVSSGAALRGSPVSGGYAIAKRAQWFLADYALNESGRADLGLKIHCLLPNLNPSTPLGRAGIEAYAARAGITPEAFAKRFEPQLTPELMGKGVLELYDAPDRFSELAYRIGGGGLTSLG
jgi:NAD(P)-dependent dehydrogenase (short-subunit alcohol dehydrogenase family)